MKISHTSTACKECVFAVYDGNTQTSCKLNKIQDYRNAEIDIVDVYDDDKNFYIINGRFCLFFRNQQVMEHHPKNTWEKIVRLQTKVPYHLILMVNKEDTLKTVKDAIRSIKQQEYEPNIVTIVNKQYPYYQESPNSYIRPSKILEILQDAEFHQYSLRNIYDAELQDREMIDLVFDTYKQHSYPFYAVFMANRQIPLEFSTQLNTAILIKMQQICVATLDSSVHGMVFNRIAHKKHGGNSFRIDLEQKILKNEENGERFIFKSDEVFPCLQK